MWFVEEQRKTKLSSKHSQSHLPHSLLYGWVLKFNCLQVNQQSNSINCEVFVVAIVFTFVLDCHQMKAVTMLLKCATTCQPVCNYRNYPLRKKCPHSVLFWSIFSRICTEYGEILCISPYSVRIRENADQNNSEYGHFSHSNHLFPKFQGCFHVEDFSTIHWHFLVYADKNFLWQIPKIVLVTLWIDVVLVVSGFTKNIWALANKSFVQKMSIKM